MASTGSEGRSHVLLLTLTLTARAGDLSGSLAPVRGEQGEYFAIKCNLY